MSKREDKDRKWESVQIKAFTSWFNGVLAGTGNQIENLSTDMCSGVLLCQFLEKATKKKLQRWDKKPSMRINEIQNLNIALSYIQKQLGVRLTGIGAEDIADGNLKLTLGTLWSLFRKLNIDSISEEGKSSEDGLLAWLQKMTEGYPGVEVNDFKDSFSDGLAFSALIHKFDEEFIDFEALDGGNKEANLGGAFDIAEQKLGIPRLLEVDDMAAGGNNIDERSVILYCSLFFHAFVASEERRKMKGEQGSFKNKMADLQAQLETAQQERDAMLARQKEFEERQLQLEEELRNRDTKINSLEDLIKALQAEIDYLRQRCANELEMRGVLEDKVALLESLLEQQARSQDERDAARKRLEAELAELRSKGTLLDKELSTLEGERSTLLTDSEEKDRRLAEMEERKGGMASELERLRAQIAEETARRQAKAAEVDRLRKLIEMMKQKEIVQGRARSGLDVLKRNLEEHLEDMYRWRDLSDDDLKEAVPDFDLGKVIADINDKSFEDQLSYLDEKLQGENSNLRRIVKLKDSKVQLADSVSKEGWLTMKGRKEWKKRWFKLMGSRLNYYEEEDATEVAGTIQLDQGCDVVRQKAVQEEGGTKKLWPLKVTVGDRKLFIRAATKRERHAWFLVLTSKIAHLNYLKDCERDSERPDTRVLNVFACEKCPDVHLDNRPLDKNAITALVKGLPGRDEISTLSMKNAELTDELFGILSEVLEKLSVKVLDFSGNSLTAASAERLAAGLAQNPGILEIRMADNKLDASAAAHIAAAISQHEHLSALNLNGNKLSDAGVREVADALAEKQVPLLKLQLANNSIGAAGAAAIGDLLNKNKNITRAELAGNEFGDDGAAALAESLKSNDNVSDIDLTNNGIGQSGAQAIKDAFEANSNLAVVNLSGNDKLISGSGLGDLLTGAGMCFPQFSLARARS